MTRRRSSCRSASASRCAREHDALRARGAQGLRPSEHGGAGPLAGGDPRRVREPRLLHGDAAGPFGYGGAYGYQEDPTGLRLLGHRYYDSSTGRFLTRDPAKDGRNWYVYCENDPANSVDPTGLEWHDPMVIYVDPGFKGRIIVVGEPGKGKDQIWVEIPPGHHSDPRMDVDYVLIIYEDGSDRVLFPMGLGTPQNPTNTTQYGIIDREGRLHVAGPVLSDTILSLLDRSTWWPKYREALRRPGPFNRPPRRGRPVP